MKAAPEQPWPISAIASILLFSLFVRKSNGVAKNPRTLNITENGASKLHVIKWKIIFTNIRYFCCLIRV